MARPSAVPDRALIPDGQKRPAGPVHLPPDPRLIEVHLTIVLAVSRWIEAATGWLIRKFVCAARRYRNIQIQAGDHTIISADLCRSITRLGVSPWTVAGMMGAVVVG